MPRCKVRVPCLSKIKKRKQKETTPPANDDEGVDKDDASRREVPDPDPSDMQDSGIIPDPDPSESQNTKNPPQIDHGEKESDKEGDKDSTTPQGDKPTGPSPEQQETIEIKPQKPVKFHKPHFSILEERELGSFASFFLGSLIHYSCVFVLTICTFPWSIGMCFHPGTKCAQGLAKVFMALSLLLNLIFIFGPYHIAQNFTSKDFIELERCAVVLAACWALINLKMFSCVLGSKSDALQLTLLDFLGIEYSPKLIRDYDECHFRPFKVCGLSEQNFYFLKLFSTFNFLISFSGALFYAFIVELIRSKSRSENRYTDYSAGLMISFAGGAFAFWYFSMKIVLQSLISTYRNFAYLKPLLPTKDDLSDNTSVVMNYGKP